MELGILLIAGIVHTLILGTSSETSDYASITPSPTLASSSYPTVLTHDFSSLDSSLVPAIRTESITQLSVLDTLSTYMTNLNSMKIDLNSTSIGSEFINSTITLNFDSSVFLSSSIPNSAFFTSFIFASTAQQSSAHFSSYSSFFLSTDLSKSASVVTQLSDSEFQETSWSDVVKTSDIGSMSNEPVSTSTVDQHTTPDIPVNPKPKKKSAKKTSTTAIVILVFLAILITVLGVVCFRRRKKCLLSGGIQRASYQRFTDDYGGEMHMTII